MQYICSRIPKNSPNEISFLQYIPRIFLHVVFVCSTTTATKRRSISLQISLRGELHSLNTCYRLIRQSLTIFIYTQYTCGLQLHTLSRSKVHKYISLRFFLWVVVFVVVFGCCCCGGGATLLLREEEEHMVILGGRRRQQHDVSS